MQSNQDWMNEFMKAAVSGREETAKAIRAANPGNVDLSIHAAAVVGDVETVRAILGRDASQAVLKGGPEHWEPLLYLSFSCFLRDPEYSERFAQTAQLLLENGANPNAFCLQKNDPLQRKLSVLYGVVGIANNPVVAKVLLEAGADPNDGESLYHAAEFPDHECLDLLHEYGVNINDTPAFHHKLDYDDDDGAQWFLEHGADPNLILGEERNTPLHWAVLRGRSIQTIQRLLEYGAHVNARRTDGKTAYVLAKRFGQTEVADLLRKHGAMDELDQVDRFLGVCALVDRAEVHAMLEKEPSLISSLSTEDQAMIIEFSELNKADSVQLMLDVGFDIEVKNEVGTALHVASWFGHINTVRVLIDYGASLTVTNAFGGTPLSSAIHGSVHCNFPSDGRHADVVEALIQAGAEVPQKADGSKEVYGMLRQYGASE